VLQILDILAVSKEDVLVGKLKERAKHLKSAMSPRRSWFTNHDHTLFWRRASSTIKLESTRFHSASAKPSAGTKSSAPATLDRV
jgi:hypothetical protein